MEHEINRLLDDEKSIFAAEGLKGTMLDIDFGSYPFRNFFQQRFYAGLVG